ncbi:inositol phosphorylceramide synthase [Flexivirga endophytica]|uniref:Inositol phosphorylceramide synthase n=1 Tax=Flexivirga endophytica TaxID=1849103 RepID=A0A916SWU6_9MICO|nr:phosphatase PAP2 family protein [Flexivirga endophytica]GGB20060.1 inositol phosphorylceramide synthase [Flexivirga endophytica]GHB35623.1 inositol phosphorylceramide synthase [Flexivirga endophytica]
MPNLMLNWRQALLVGLVLGALWPVLRHRWPGVATFCREGAIVAWLFAFWQILQQVTSSDGGDAVGRAHWIERLQSAMLFPNERSVQNLILGHDTIVELANLFYASMHFTGMGIFLVWLYFRHRDSYPAVRTTIALSTLGCFFVQFLAVAPPRLLPGYVDTAEFYGQSVYNAGFSVDNFGAMPSVHVLFAAVIGWYTWRVSTSRWRWIGPLHFVVTVFVVVATANHWWLDGVVAIAILIGAAWLRHGVLALVARLRETTVGTVDAPDLEPQVPVTTP